MDRPVDPTGEPPADAADPGALHVASSFLDDAEVPAEAAAATLKVAGSLVRIDAPAVRAAMKKLMDTTKDKTVADQAAAIDEEAKIRNVLPELRRMLPEALIAIAGVEVAP